MKFHLGYFIKQYGVGPTTYHYSQDEKRSLCGIEDCPALGWERTAFPAEQQLKRFKGMKGRKNRRRYCKTCLKILETKREAISRLADLT